MRNINKTTIFTTALYAFEAVCLSCIILLSYSQVKREWVSILPMQDLPFFKELLTMFFVLMLVAMLWLATDRFTYLLGCFIRYKQQGLKNIHGESTDFITFLGQTLLVGSLSISSLFLSLHFTTSGASAHLSQEITKEIATINFSEISNKFQAKETEIETKYQILKDIEQKKYNRMVSYKSVELAQQAINDLEANKQKDLQDLRNQRDRELQEAQELQKRQKETLQEKKKVGDYVGLSFEFLAICCAIAIQVLQRPERSLQEVSEISTEISNEKTEISNEKDFEQLLAKYYNEVRAGKLKQYEVAKLLGVSPVKVSRLFKNMKKPNKANEYSIGDNFGW